MSLLVSHRFAKKHGGYEAVRKFIQMCNNAEYTLRDIAAEFGMSVPQVCRYRNKLFDVQYAPKHGVIKFLEEMRDRDKMNVDKKDKFINEIHNNITYVNFKPTQNESQRA